jgi:uncharacterized protein YhfF
VLAQQSVKQPSSERLDTWVHVEKRGLAETLLDLAAWAELRAATAGETSMEWEDAAEMIGDLVALMPPEGSSFGPKYRGNDDEG